MAGRHGDGWRLRVAAPPEDGRANQAVERLMARALGVHRARRQDRARLHCARQGDRDRRARRDAGRAGARGRRRPGRVSPVRETSPAIARTVPRQVRADRWRPGAAGWTGLTVVATAAIVADQVTKSCDLELAEARRVGRRRSDAVALARAQRRHRVRHLHAPASDRRRAHGPRPDLDARLLRPLRARVTGSRRSPSGCCSGAASRT